jgi:uncharacterized membrane protein
VTNNSEANKFLQNLKSETDEWLAENIISSIQQQTILNRYIDVNFKTTEGKNYSRLVTILATLGSFTTGLGAILFIAGNWGAIPLFGKLLLMIFAIIGANLSGYWIQYIKNVPRIGSACFFLGAILFGGSTFLVAQAYHLEANNPDLLLWWLAGIFPIAYITKTRSVFILSIVILFIWPGWKISNSDATIQILIPTYLALGAITYSIGKILRERIIPNYFDITLIFTGAMSIFGSIYLLSFPGTWSWWRPENNLLEDTTSLLLMAVITLLFAISLALLTTVKPMKMTIIAKNNLVLYELSILFIIWTSSYLIFFNPDFTNSDTLFAIFFNLLFLVMAIITIFYGIFQKYWLFQSCYLQGILTFFWDYLELDYFFYL